MASPRAVGRKPTCDLGESGEWTECMVNGEKSWTDKQGRLWADKEVRAKATAIREAKKLETMKRKRAAEKEEAEPASPPSPPKAKAKATPKAQSLRLNVHTLINKNRQVFRHQKRC